jgi:hypothetical protein
MASGDQEKRYRDLIEKIDPNIKKERLEAQRKTLSGHFLGAYKEYHSQAHLLVRHQSALEEAPKVEDLTPDEVKQLNQLLGRSAAAAQRANLAEIVRVVTEQTRQAKLIMEHWADELEATVAELDTIAGVGAEKEKTGESDGA